MLNGNWSYSHGIKKYIYPMGKNNPVGKFNLWIQCNMKYVLEKKLVNIFSIFPLQTVEFQLGISNFTRSWKRTSCNNLLSSLL